MSKQSLAVKYRPQEFEDVYAQDEIILILQRQLETGTFKNAYLFCGSAGTGKTTCARIFAKEINNGHGNPIEMDAASNNSVEDVRMLSQQAKTKSLDSEYKIFIIDECHALSNTAWQAMLKLIEEPPAKSIFIFCTTDPQKIPKTILSRVQRYDFQRIATQTIVERLQFICTSESQGWDAEPHELEEWDEEALEFIAEQAEGGMRDAITMLDKCLSLCGPSLTLDFAIRALGLADTHYMVELLSYLSTNNSGEAIALIDKVYFEGIDLKQFIRHTLTAAMDCAKLQLGCRRDNLSSKLPALSTQNIKVTADMVDMLINLNRDIKWDTSPKSFIEATFYVFCEVKR